MFAIPRFNCTSEPGHYYLKIGQLDSEIDDELKTLEEVRKWYLSAGDPQKIRKLASVLSDFLPGLKYEEVTGRTCATCYSPSGQPYIDRVSPTLAVAAVGNGRGAKISDEVGRIAAVLCITGKWDSELSQSHFKVIRDVN